MVKHNKVFPNYQSDYEGVFAGYLAEAEGLASIVSSNKIRDYLSAFSDYTGYLKKIDCHDYKKSIRKIIKKYPIIDIIHNSDLLRDVFFMAHLAACCELFKNVSFPIDSLSRSNIRVTITHLLSQYKNDNTGSVAINRLDHKLHSADAVRTIQILRLLGLIRNNQSDITQLSLGAGSAEKDLRSMHLKPEIKMFRNSDGSINSIGFGMTESRAKDVVIIDGDPQRKEQYEELNKTDDYKILAINNDTYETLDVLPDLMSKKGMKKRNLIIAFRIDYRMISDVDQLFRLLINVVADYSDLVITIGSGHDIDDFKGRIDIIKELFDFLKDRGMSPFLIKLHRNGGIEDQWNNHAFGMKGTTTYQILYCKIKLNKLPG